jgi:nucleoside-diphosphate-sugar epimerase
MADARTVAVTGATGFIGSHLIKTLRDDCDLTVRALTRRPPERHEDVEWLAGDLLDPDVASSLADGADAIVHLAYSGAASPEANVRMGRNVVQAANRSGCSHLIHCSTAVVVGEAEGDLVSESTPCRPRTNYQRTKYELELVIAKHASDGLALSMVRPTAVFGVGGKNLVTLIAALREHSLPINLLRSFLHGSRTMNLVPVEDVARALGLLSIGPDYGGLAPTGGPRIVSADDDGRNNFRTVERLVAEAIGRTAYRGSPIAAPRQVLALVQALKTGEKSPPCRRYESEFPEWHAAVRRADLGRAVQSFARHVVEARG